MSLPELAQLELLAQVDELMARLTQWAEPASAWEPLNHCRALVRRLLRRVETLRVRLEAPLVVATFGGTGTGKSSLVNALIGQDVTQAGRQRPTTTQPVVIAHPETDLEQFGLPLDELRIVRNEAPILRDIVLIDCPDPDTSETDMPGSNLQRLRLLLPHCDVLIYTSTQQKYRSARVVGELAEAATGCRLVFVQTHAELDSDIRDDWRKQLAEHYRIADMFFVDSLRAFREQQAGQRPSGEFGRLLDLLNRELSSSQRVRIRRANLLDLIQGALQHCRTHFDKHQPAVEQLETALAEQRQQLIARMSDQLRDELLLSRNLWERRLLSSVTTIWGFSPFSSVLRLYNGLGGFIASMGLYRARNSAQMALIGAVQGARWLASRQQEQAAESKLARVAFLGPDDAALREAQVIIQGYVQSAHLDVQLAEPHSLETLRSQAVRVEDQFLGDASRRIDDIIDRLAVRNSGWLVRAFYEVLFLVYVVYVLARVGWNFFYESFWLDERILDMNFYIPAAVFFVLWSGALVMAYTRRLERGLRRRIEELARELAQTKVGQGLFPRLEQACREIVLERGRLEALHQTATTIRADITQPTALGAQLVQESWHDALRKSQPAAMPVR